MSDGQGRHVQMERELGRALTGEVAPEELPFYDEILAAEELPRRNAKDHPLGFGVQELGYSISLAMFAIGKVVLAFLWENAKGPAGILIKDLTSQGSEYVLKSFKEWAERGVTEPAPVSVEPHAKSVLLKLVDDEATRLSLSEEERARVKDAIERAFPSASD